MICDESHPSAKCAEEWGSRDGGAMKAVALWMLREYKRWVSPAFPPACRYVPTCSEYAWEAVERYGVVRGGMMAAGRLLRCHPLAKGGLDLVAGPILPQRTGKDGAPGAIATH